MAKVDFRKFQYVVMVTGARHHTDRDLIWEALDYQKECAKEARKTMILLEGGAPGADRFAKIWAEQNLVYVETFKADWENLGKAAGPVRNQAMINMKPDIVLAFPLGESKGTYDAIRRARLAGIKVLTYTPDGE